MSTSFYDPGEQRAARVEDLFAAIAPRYDLINDLQSLGLHRWWKRKLLQLAQPKSGERALDLCCGTGDIAFSMARLGVQIIGADFSLPMLQAAERRSFSARAELIRADALRLPFRDNSFDLVTIGYGLRNLAGVENGFREMHRVLKTGGRALILDFGKPRNSLVRFAYYTYLRAFVPLFGRIFCGNSATHAYIYESLMAYPAQYKIAEFMKESGWTNIRIHNLLGGTMSINMGVKE